MSFKTELETFIATRYPKVMEILRNIPNDFDEQRKCFVSSIDPIVYEPFATWMCIKNISANAIDSEIFQEAFQMLIEEKGKYTSYYFKKYLKELKEKIRGRISLEIYVPFATFLTDFVVENQRKCIAPDYSLPKENIFLDLIMLRQQIQPSSQKFSEIFLVSSWKRNRTCCFMILIMMKILSKSWNIKNRKLHDCQKLEPQKFQ